MKSPRNTHTHTTTTATESAVHRGQVLPIAQQQVPTTVLLTLVGVGGAAPAAAYPGQATPVSCQGISQITFTHMHMHTHTHTHTHTHMHAHTHTHTHTHICTHTHTHTHTHTYAWHTHTCMPAHTHTHAHTHTRTHTHTHTHTHTFHTPTTNNNNSSVTCSEEAGTVLDTTLPTLCPLPTISGSPVRPDPERSSTFSRDSQGMFSSLNRWSGSTVA